jgi:hypothetical protein
MEKKKKKTHHPYLSSLHRNEVAALVFRFHDAGWIHGSIGDRNILTQPGPLCDIPLERHVNIMGLGVNRDFRLIDFGRASENKNRDEYHRKYSIKEDEYDIRRVISYDGVQYF